jgi:integrase
LNRGITIAGILGNKPLTEVTNDDIQILVDVLKEQGLEDSTVNRYLAHVKTMYILARDKWQVISIIPYMKLSPEPEGRTRITTYEEEEELYRIFSNSADQQMIDICTCLTDTGARASNILTLESNCINFRTGMVTFWKNKTDKPYSVAMTERVREVLERRTKNTTGARLFTYTLNQVERRWQKAKKEMNLEYDNEFLPHGLRHTCASRLIENDVDIYTVKGYLNHSNIKTTERYAHLKQNKIIRAANTLNNRIIQRIEVIPC